MKTTTSDFPPKLQPFASLLDAQPPEVQEAFQFLLASAMHEAGKFELVSVAEVDGKWHYTFRSTTGDTFCVVRPERSLAQKQDAVPRLFSYAEQRETRGQ